MAPSSGATKQAGVFRSILTHSHTPFKILLEVFVQLFGNFRKQFDWTNYFSQPITENFLT